MFDDLAALCPNDFSPRRPLTAIEVDYPNGALVGLHAQQYARLLATMHGIIIVYSSAGSWIAPPNQAVWVAAGLDHEVRMCGDVKVRIVFVDPGAASGADVRNRGVAPIKGVDCWRDPRPARRRHRRARRAFDVSAVG